MVISSLYWNFAALASTFSLGNALFVAFKIIQVSNGRYLLDSEAPAGLKLRKWFLTSICASNTVRFLSILVEVASSVWFTIDPQSIWALRCFPIVVFLCSNSFITHYLGNLHYSLKGSEGRTFRLLWIISSGVFIGAELICFTMLLATTGMWAYDSLHVVFLVLAVHCTIILGTVWYFAVKVWRSLARSQATSQSTKVIVRMLLLIFVVTLSLLGMFGLLMYRYEAITVMRESRVYNPSEWLFVVLVEAPSSLLMTLVMTNSLTAIETRMRNWILGTSDSSDSSIRSSSRIGSVRVSNKRETAPLNEQGYGISLNRTQYQAVSTQE